MRVFLFLVLFFYIASILGQADSMLLKRDSIVELALSLEGTTYKYGGTLPESGFDCSGFCYYVFKKNGVKVPRTSASYHNKGLEISLSEAKKGDVILFTGTNPDVKVIGHVGIVISEQGENLQFIHSSSSKKHYGVTITDYHQSSYPKRFMKIIRIL